MSAAIRQASALSDYDRGFRDGQAAIRRKLAAVLDELQARCRPAPVAANDDRVQRLAPPVARNLPNRKQPAPATLALRQRVLDLLTVRNEPLKARDIAATLSADYGDVTRACSALSELRLANWAWGPVVEGRKSKFLSPLDGQTPPKPAPVVPIRTKISRPAAAPSADDLAPPSKVAAPRSLNARKPGECAYPVNSPAPGRGEETEYCCEPVAGKLSYCEAHARAMWPSRKAQP